jgi:hypothetical protein
VNLRFLVAAAAAASTSLLGGCASWFFSGLPKVDRSRPVALIETTGGVEYGATTELGILCLGRTATTGPCRVHYFLGPTPMIEDGRLLATGTTFCRAEIDLRTQNLRVLARDPTPADNLVAMYTPTGQDVVEVPVRLATRAGITGDVLEATSTELPAGSAVFAQLDQGLRFCGLIAGKAKVAGPGGQHEYYVFAGVDRVRELLAVPEPFPQAPTYRHRPDGITVTRPDR